MITDAVAIALITGGTTTVAATIAAWVSVMNGRKSDKQAVKVEEIHTLTNSANETLKKELAAAVAQITALNAVVAKLAKTER